jgi:hypothetical protein
MKKWEDVVNVIKFSQEKCLVLINIFIQIIEFNIYLI